MRYITLSIRIFLFLLPAGLLAQTEKIGTAMMSRIRQEEMNNSKIMDIGFNLTEASGPRLTSSPGFFRAANYAKSTLAQWGLVNAMLDPWGDFGKSWELQKSYVAMTAPWYKTLNAIPKVWTSSTNGAVSADVILISDRKSVV